MGFLKFIRQNDEVQRPKEQEIGIRSVRIPQTPVSQDTARQEIRRPQPLSINEKKQKDEACDFFKVKINNIFAHKPEFREKTEPGNGRSVEKFTLKLN